jgi:hypothetical protein
MIDDIEEIIEIHSAPGTAMAEVGVSEDYSQGITIS